MWWRRQWQPTPVLLPGKSHGQRSLVGCSPWGRLESDMTELLHFHFSLSCIGEGNGNPTAVFLPGESQGWGRLVGCHLWGRTVRHDWSDLAAAAAAYSTISFTFFTKSTGNLKLSTTEANFWSSHTKTLISYLNKGLLCSSYSEQILRPIGLPILIPDPWLNGLSSFYL